MHHHNRRTLHQPFLPQAPPPPPQLFPKYPFSSNTPQLPFFPNYPSPPPPSPLPSTIPTFPAVIAPSSSSHSTPHHPKLLPLLIFSLLALALLALFLSFLFHRKRCRRRLKPEPVIASATATSAPLPTRDFLYLGTIVNSQAIRGHSPDLRPLSRNEVWAANSNNYNNANDDFYSPDGSETVTESVEVEEECESNSSSVISMKLYSNSSWDISIQPLPLPLPLPALNNSRIPPPPPPPAGFWERRNQKPAVKKSVESVKDLDSGLKSEETLQPKLKAFHWDKVRASSDRAMVWDQLKSSSFQVNEEMMETLFGCTSAENTVTKETRKQCLVVDASQKVENRVLDPKKAQNIAILLRALNVTKEEVCEALLEGNAESLGTELLETLQKLAPTKRKSLN